MSLLGKVFISHASADKPFVRALAQKIDEAGFEHWLDERELTAGEPLASGIAEAVAKAKVLLVVLSRAAVASNWLRHELNIANVRRVKRECDVIPIIIDDTDVPSVVLDLVYADCRTSLEDGWPRILKALKAAARRAEQEAAFYLQANALVEEAFGGLGDTTLSDNYRSLSYRTVNVLAGYEGVRDLYVPYDSVALDGFSPALGEEWWADYLPAMAECGEEISLIISERPVDLQLDRYADDQRRVGIRRHISEDDIEHHAVIVNWNGLPERERRLDTLVHARQLLVNAAVTIGRRKTAEEEVRRLLKAK